MSAACQSAPIPRAEKLPLAGHALIGLAALARRAMRGEDLSPLAQSLLLRLCADPGDASALLDLSTIEQLLGASGNRRSLQEQALRRQRHFFQQRDESAPAPRLTLLALVAPGDFMANTPLEFLLEEADIQLAFLYVDGATNPLAEAPPHDVAFVAVAESAANQAALAVIARVAAQWPRPLLNAPEAIALLTRDGAWRLLGDIAGVIYPPNEKIGRQDLLAGMTEKSGERAYPIIVRPVDSHAGAGLEKIESGAELAAYLASQQAAAFYIAPFVDYRSNDGMYRKMRIAVVDGKPFIVHLAISPRWMIHYLNADMTENAVHRDEERRFMAAFDVFAQRHVSVFTRMSEKLRLDYFLIDCAEAPGGELLIFEVGTAMIVHDLDDPQIFPYKSAPMRRIFAEFEKMLLSRAPA